MKSWFLSDIHLQNTHERNGATLLRFLFYLNQNPKEHRIFLLGDIFDAWVSDGSAFVKKFELFVNEIKKLKAGGAEIYYFEGNHDMHIDIFWTKQFGIPVIEEMEYFNIDGLIVRVEHGDLMNPDDKAYLQYRDLVHKPWVEFLGHNLPSRFWMWITEAQSRKSRKKTSRYAEENGEKIANLIRTHAKKSFNDRPFDLIVTGHMHIFDDYEFETGGKNIRSVNLGTWLEKPRVLLLENKNIQILEVESISQHS